MINPIIGALLFFGLGYNAGKKSKEKQKNPKNKKPQKTNSMSPLLKQILEESTKQMQKNKKQ